MAEAAVGELALDRLDRAHQRDALAHRIERLGVLRHADLGERVDDRADAGGVDADLGEQSRVLDALHQVDDEADVGGRRSGSRIGRLGRPQQRGEDRIVAIVGRAWPKRNTVRSPAA
jgi:hypothetical protein